MTVGVVTQGQTAVVTLSEEASNNAFDAVSMAAISAELTRLMDDPDIRSIVITGSGRVFCAGADIQSFKYAIEDGSAADLVATLTGILHPLLVRMRGDPTVMVAAMNGAAAGGGLGLALACDVRIASTNARMASAFFRLGLSPDGGTTWLLPRLVGIQNTRRFLFEDQTWSAEKALDLGAVDEVVEADELIPRAIRIAMDWGRWSDQSKRSTKQLLDSQSSTFFETQLEFERMLITESSRSPDFVEGVESFLEKRDPIFYSSDESE
jgi:enoyl-CoA hydratase/carnithine racemase